MASSASSDSSSESSSASPHEPLDPYPFSSFARQISAELEGRGHTPYCPHNDHGPKASQRYGEPKRVCSECQMMFCKEHFIKLDGRCVYCTETLRLAHAPSFLQDLDNVNGMAAEDVDFSINADKDHEEYYYYPYKAGDRLRVGPRLQAKLRCKEYMAVVKLDTATGDYEAADKLAEELPYDWCMLEDDGYNGPGDRALNQIGNSLQEEDAAQKRRHRIMRLRKVRAMIDRKLQRLYYKPVEISEPAKPVAE